MIIRLLPILSALVLIAGCGGPSDAPGDRTGQAQAVPSSANRAEPAVDRTSPSPESSDAPDASRKPGSPDELEDEEGDGGNDSLRKWTDPAGKTLARAELIDLLDGKVCLQTEDGRGMVIPLQELSRADQAYVKSRVPETPAEPREPKVRQEETEAASDPGLVVETGDGPPEPTAPQGDTSPREKIVIPFDFVSTFDNGRYGAMVADMIWKKLEREGGVIIPESIGDVRDTCERKKYQIGPTTKLEEVGKIVRGEFQGHVGIWGSVERAPGAEWEIYDLVIKCVDFSAQPEPKLIYQVSARTNSVSEIPHLYVKQMLDKLYGREPGGPPPVDLLAEENWKNNPNLVEGGDFQRGGGGVPAGWAPGWEGGFVGQYEPLGNVVKWIPEAGNPQNRVIRFTMDQALADSTGVPYYSDPFPIEEGAKYRFRCRWRSNGPTMKVFIKCYDEVGTEYAEASKRTSSQVGSGLRRDSYIPESTQLRECYRSQQNLYGPKNTWNTQVQDFTPKHTKYTPRWGRVMLYAYHPAGMAEFDDVVLKQILPASPGAGKEDARHSMESTVTIKQMEENERRGREAAERLRQKRAKEP